MYTPRFAFHLVTALLLVVALPCAIAEDKYGVDSTSGQEEKLDVPTFPSEQNLVRLDTQFDGYRYFIDKRSISVAEDQVVRYTVVIDSENGVRNVFYEGIRCDVRKFKTYAFGSGRGPFHRVHGKDWQDIKGDVVFRYRRDLVDYFVCDGPTARSDAGEIVKRIANPPSNYDSSYSN